MALSCMKQCRSTCSVHGCGRHGRVQTGVIDCLHVHAMLPAGVKNQTDQIFSIGGKKSWADVCVIWLPLLFGDEPLPPSAIHVKTKWKASTAYHLLTMYLRAFVRGEQWNCEKNYFSEEMRVSRIIPFTPKISKRWQVGSAFGKQSV